MKKTNFLLPSLFAVALLSSSCEKTETQSVQPATTQATAQDFTVVDGHLVFADRMAISHTLNKLLNLSAEELQQWEKKYQGFTSLRAATGDVAVLQQRNSLLNKAYFSLFNEHALLQVGAEMVMLNDNKMLVFPADDAALLARMQTALLSNSPIHESLVRVHPLKEVTYSHQESSPTEQQRDYLDAKYQLQFTANGVGFKHVHEVLGFPNYLSCDIVVRVKFEYKKKNSWVQAGESIEKRISNLNITGSALTPWGVQQVSVVNASRYSFDNQNLEYYLSVPADEVSAQVSADMYSTAFGYTYDNRGAYWGDVYVSKY